VAAPLYIQEGERLPWRGGILATPDGVEPALAGLARRIRNHYFRLHVSLRAAFQQQLDPGGAGKRHGKTHKVPALQGARRHRSHRRPPEAVTEKVSRRNVNGRPFGAVPVDPQQRLAGAAAESLGRPQAQREDAPWPRLLEDGHRHTRLEHVLPAHGTSGRRGRRHAERVAGLKGAHRSARPVQHVVDLVELHAPGADHHLDPLGELQRRVGVIAARAGARQRPAEQPAERHPQPRRTFPVEIEFHRIVGGRGRPDARKRSGAAQFGDHQPVALFSQEAVLARKAVVVTAAAVVARKRAHPDHLVAEARQVVEAQQPFGEGGRERRGGRQQEQKRFHLCSNLPHAHQPQLQGPDFSSPTRIVTRPPTAREVTIKRLGFHDQA